MKLDAVYGSNRAFLLNALPHIGRVMEKSLDPILAWAELMVITQEPNAESKKVLAKSAVPVIDVASAEVAGVTMVEAVQ